MFEVNCFIVCYFVSIMYIYHLKIEFQLKLKFVRQSDNKGISTKFVPFREFKYEIFHKVMPAIFKRIYFH